ncbi:MAG: ABC transporter ATP-binding protein [Rhodospirillales bacterium]|nr:ABC transporter ATP-binding protein [Alphaproteobacteria bacterium]MCB9987363.1 ABC transporter ATP-binding protein [Rhodospirillales bacterium]USO07789.1 MAG: ABC transporter ATP-binding protein [Rhodospirillales bacterium]
MSEPVLKIENLRRTYRQADSDLHVLNGVSFAVGAGEMVALMGQSGSGKSTLLQCAGLLDTPSAGSVAIAGRAAEKLNEGARTALRRETIGFVYQAHHLLPEFSALENIMLPMMIAGQTKGDARARAAKMLDALGLAARADHRPARLSGGEQQRVAIARALANRPKLLLADEPTGNLDPDTAESVFKMLETLVRKTGVAMLMATHNPDLAARMDRVLRLDKGVIL